MIFESDHWHVALCDNQVYLGAVYITSKRMAAKIIELTAEEWLDLREVIGQYESALSEAYGSQAIVWSSVYQPVEKSILSSSVVRYVSYPRYNKEVSVGNVIFADPGLSDNINLSLDKRVDGRTKMFILLEIQRSLHVN